LASLSILCLCSTLRWAVSVSSASDPSGCNRVKVAGSFAVCVQDTRCLGHYRHSGPHPWRALCRWNIQFKLCQTKLDACLYGQLSCRMAQFDVHAPAAARPAMGAMLFSLDASHLVIGLRVPAWTAHSTTTFRSASSLQTAGHSPHQTRSFSRRLLADAFVHRLLQSPACPKAHWWGPK
jgi:hypothetical protein